MKSLGITAIFIQSPSFKQYNETNIILNMKTVANTWMKKTLQSIAP